MLAHRQPTLPVRASDFFCTDFSRRCRVALRSDRTYSGSHIELTTAKRTTIFSAPMEGATKARAAFRKACGI